jgi:hypothetical protein
MGSPAMTCGINNIDKSLSHLVIEYYLAPNDKHLVLVEDSRQNEGTSLVDSGTWFTSTIQSLIR